MLLKELIKKVKYEEVWKVLKREYNLPEKAKDPYEDAIKELSILSGFGNTSNDEMTIVVGRFEDFSESGTLIFDVFGIIPNDNEHYSMNLEPWRNWVNYPILGKSIGIYGEAEVLAHILYEMTFYGFTEEDVGLKHKEVLEILKESEEQEKGGMINFVSAEEVHKSLGLDVKEERDSEEINRQRKETKRIMEKNNQIMEELLIDWI